MLYLKDKNQARRLINLIDALCKWYYAVNDIGHAKAETVPLLYL
jgi:hypothetical protein